MVYRSSWSQNWRFTNHPRWWFYEKVMKIPTIQDMCYADAGTVIHECLEKYYSGEVKGIEDLKNHFNLLWEKYKLPDTKLRLKKDEYWLMVVNGVNKALAITDTELKIYFPDVVGYIDAFIKTPEGEIVFIDLDDWKSSQRRKENEEEYSKQLMFYAYLVRRHFDITPRSGTVHYLRFTGSKGELKIHPTKESVDEMEKWHWDCNKKMEDLQESKKLPSKCENCNMFCPYENICAGDNDGILHYDINIVGNDIEINGQMPNILHAQLKRKFSYELKSAFFMKKHNPNAITTVEFWNLNRRKMPIGFLKEVLKTLNDYAQSKYANKPINIKINDTRVFDLDIIKMPDKFVNDKVLRDYQEEAVEKFLENKIGILEIGTGGGKTEIATEIIRRLKMKTLFIVDKVELLKQTKKRLEESLGFEVGQIGHGKQDIKDVTVATVQTINKNLKELQQYLGTVRLAIFDECHKAAARTYMKIGRRMKNTEYRLGISGTAFRDDGNDMMINAVVGYPVYNLSSKVLIANGWLMKPKITFIDNYLSKDEVDKLKRNSMAGLINESEGYQNFYNNYITKNEVRNDIIKKLVEQNNDKKILILVKLIEHGEILSELTGGYYLHGSVSKKEREKIFNDFAHGDVKILISTISIFAEGIDIPSLTMIINAAANRGDVKTVQVLGRILRKLDGKNEAHYYDFIDDSNFFNKASRARKLILKKEGHDVDVKSVEEVINNER